MIYSYDPGNSGGVAYDPTKSGTDVSPAPTNPVQITPPDPNSEEGGGSSGSAADMTAQLLRDQFADWQKLFMPIELNQMQQLSFNNPGVLDNAVQQAGGAALQQSETMYGNEGQLKDNPNQVFGVLERQNRAMGITPTAQQSAVTRRLMDLNKAQNVAGAENTAREDVRLQDSAILMGQLPNPNISKGII